MNTRLPCALLAAALGLAGSANGAGAVAARHGDVDIRLVSTAGAPLPGAVARVMIVDGFVRGQSTQIHTVSPDATGWVHVDFPYDDPYVLAHPDQQRFNVEVDVAVPTVNGLRTTTATGFVFDRFARREVSVKPVSGTTMLVDLARVPTDSRASVAADPLDCDKDMAEYECADTTYPSNMNSVPVVFAHNAGAGYDTTLALTYDRAGEVQTTVAHDFGAGIVEVDSSQSISNSDTVGLSFGGGSVRYGNPYEWAVVNSAWTQTTRYHCKKPDWPFTSSTYCDEDGLSWAPYHVTGSAQVRQPDPDNPLWHDRLCVFGCDVPDNVCVEEFAIDYTRGHGEEVGREYTAGLNVHGSIYGITLHASAKYVRSDNTSTQTVYKYHAVHPDGTVGGMKHALFTHSTTSYDVTKPGGGICPSVDIGEAWTATNHEFPKPTPQEQQGTVDQVSSATGNSTPSSTYRKVGRCAYVPDDCRP
jgi:hypothetical protein